MTTDSALYKPKHRRGDCECQLMGADPDQVANILLQGRYPLSASTETPNLAEPKPW